MPPPWILALDLGTSNVKALGVAADGQILTQHEVGLDLHHPTPDTSELDPDAVVAAARQVIANATQQVATGCAGICISGAMHGMIAVDDAGQPLTKCWTWADRRAAESARDLHARGLAPGLLARTGTPVHAMSPLCKLLWLRDHQPATWAKARYFLGVKDYLLQALGVPPTIDHSLASATGLLALRSLQWDPPALALLELEPSRLPLLVPTTHVLRLQPASGLPDVPVVLGASDGALANLGAGAVDQGVLAVTLGTSGAARAVVPAPQVDPAGQLFCYALTERQWVVGGAINNAGLALGWLARCLTGHQPLGSPQAKLARLVTLAEQAPLGAGGVVALPFVAGERFAAWQPDAPAVVLGMTHAHGPEHLSRAWLEGCLGVLATIVAAIERNLGPSREVRFGGGLAAAPLVRQMLADFLGRRVTMLASEQSSALGAARLGFAALGIAAAWHDVTAHCHDPEPSAHAGYQRVLARQQRLYQATLALKS